MTKENDDKMKIVVAIDSFKGSLTSLEAGNAAKEGILRASRSHEVIVKPLADGGEGTTEAFVTGYGGEFITIPVRGPLNNEVIATYGYIEEDMMAIIEMASSSGIMLLDKGEKNPKKANTYGFGEMIADALDRGCKKIILGIGGSATNDGGIGMLHALGYDFLGKDGKTVSIGGEGLKEIRTINIDKVNPKLQEAYFQVACDVNNPLLGLNGATHIYGPQKGVTEIMRDELEHGMKNFSRITIETMGKGFTDYPGSGAAGGLGYALLSYLDADLKPGVDLVLKAIDLEQNIRHADLVFTGEGRIDAQSAMGKAPGGVMKLSKKYGVKVIALGGSVTRDVRTLNEMGMDACFSILNEIVTLDEAMDAATAKRNISQTTEQIMKILDN